MTYREESCSQVMNRVSEAADGRGISSRWITASGKPEYTRQRT